MTLWMTLVGCSLFSSPHEPITFDTSLDPPVVTIRDACLAECKHRHGTAEGCPAETTAEFLVDCRDDCATTQAPSPSAISRRSPGGSAVQTIGWVCPQGVEDPVSLDASLCRAAISVASVRRTGGNTTDTGTTES